MLFTGDIEKRAEQHLLGKIGKVDVLKVPHHGSRSSSSFDFISELEPSYSIISCGKNNSFGHPHQETLWALRGSQIFRTDQLGSIFLRSDGNTLSIKHDVETLF